MNDVKILYLDNHHEIVPKETAVFMVKQEIDVDGIIQKEIWIRLGTPKIVKIGEVDVSQKCHGKNC
jgi:hypothetical protein